ncbi:MAG TPA: SRPBCC family protein [Pseudolysinimonas sp.]|nr:SRPBCC family protein [Pseudolysinimonas sp.]
MPERTLTHDTFRLERDYPVPPAKVFQAFADPAIKQLWWGGAADGFTAVAETTDFREGGRDHQSGHWADGTESVFDAVYYEITENERLVYGYEMHVNGVRLSVSLASIELAATDAGTRLTLTEQGTYFDALDNPAQRKEGTSELLDRLGTVVVGG